MDSKAFYSSTVIADRKKIHGQQGFPYKQRTDGNMKKLKKKENIMGLKRLAEGIILQSMEDLWDKHHKEDCVAFFKGKGFRDCAEMAGMTTSDQIRLLNLVKSIIDNQREKRKPKVKSYVRIMGQHELSKDSLSYVM